MRALTVLLCVFGIVVCCAADAHGLTKKEVRAAQRGVPKQAARWAPMVNKYWGRWLERDGRRLSASVLHRSLLVIWRESRGIPTARTGSFCGLFQLWTAHANGMNLYDPRTNISLAGQHYVAKGWAPWASTAY